MPRKREKIFNVDPNIGYNVLLRIIQAINGLIVLFLVTTNLSSDEQGYYFTFASLLALSVFFELGFSNVVIQFVSHENANLTWRNGVVIGGKDESISRLASIFSLSMKWFGVASSLMFLALVFSGLLFFSKFTTFVNVVEWKIPWFIMSLSSSLMLVSVPILALFDGLGRFSEVAKYRIFQQVLQICLALLLFYNGFKLYSMPIALFTSFVILPIWLASSKRLQLLKFLFNHPMFTRVNYRSEVFPLQWKIALSWLSGYFIFQLFTPVIFATDGPKSAGQIGMTLSVLNAVMIIVSTWMTTKVPLFSKYIVKSDFVILDTIFKKTLLQSTAVFLVLVSFLLIILSLCDYFKFQITSSLVVERFLPYRSLFLLILTYFLNHFVSAWAVYLRSHKREPLLVVSVVMGIAHATFMLFGSKGLNIENILLGNLILTAIGFIWSYLIYQRKKVSWHN